MLTITLLAIVFLIAFVAAIVGEVLLFFACCAMADSHTFIGTREWVMFSVIPASVAIAVTVAARGWVRRVAAQRVSVIARYAALAIGIPALTIFAFQENLFRADARGMRSLDRTERRGAMLDLVKSARGQRRLLSVIGDAKQPILMRIDAAEILASAAITPHESYVLLTEVQKRSDLQDEAGPLEAALRGTLPRPIR